MTDVSNLARQILAGNLSLIPLLEDALREDTSTPELRQFQLRSINRMQGMLIAKITGVDKVRNDIKKELKKISTEAYVSMVKERLPQLSERAEKFIENKRLGDSVVVSDSPKYSGLEENEYDDEETPYRSNNQLAVRSQIIVAKRDFYRDFLILFWRDILTEGEHLLTLHELSERLPNS